MKTLNKKVLATLEQYYSGLSMDQLTNTSSDESLDVPNVRDGKDYKTYMLFPGLIEDVMEPVIKTKKGKTILREPPDEDLKDNEIKDIEMYDEDGDKIENWDSELEELDRSELEEMVNVIDEDFILEKEKKEDPVEDEEDDNGMGDLAQTNMGEQNPSSGQDPNTQQGMENPDPTQMTAGQDASMGQDPSAGMGGMSGLGGVGGDQSIDSMTGKPKYTSQEVGRIFELKKIYSRLLSIESQLSFSSDLVLLKLRKFVSDTIELFETLISNIDAFKEEIDEIIVMFYNFLTQIYEILKKYYKKKETEEQIEKNKQNSRALP